MIAIERYDGEVPKPLMEELAETIAETKACKVAGCTRPAVKQKGPYGRLCAVHVEQAKEAYAQRRAGGTPAFDPAAEPDRPGAAGEIARVAQEIEEARLEHEAAGHRYRFLLDRLQQLTAAELDRVGS